MLRPYFRVGLGTDYASLVTRYDGGVIMIILNGRDYDLTKEMSVKELIDECRYIFPMKIVTVNGTIIKKEEYGNFIIKQNDKVDIIHLMSGG